MSFNYTWWFRWMLQSVEPVCVQSVVLHVRWSWIITYGCSDGWHEQRQHSDCGQWWLCSTVGNSCVQLIPVPQSVAQYDRWCLTAAESAGTVYHICRPHSHAVVNCCTAAVGNFLVLHCWTCSVPTETDIDKTVLTAEKILSARL